MAEWSLRDARNRFSALVNAALAGEPQRVKRRGKPAVVVLAVEEYERLRRLERASAPALGELLLEIPQDDGYFERLSLAGRRFSGGGVGCSGQWLFWNSRGWGTGMIQANDPGTKMTN